MKHKEVLSKNLKKLRIQNGFTQQSLAEQLCLSQQAIYKYEQGLATPSIWTLLELAEVFHTSVDELLGKSVEASRKSK